MSNAGITRDGLVLRMSEDDFTSVLDTNLTGGFRVAKRAVRSMMRRRCGRIVFISSVVGLVGQAGQANYAASKAGLVGLARSLAREFASRNITVNVVAPGPIATDMTDALHRRATHAPSPTPCRSGRFGTPDEVAAAVAFLASDDAAYITGDRGPRRRRPGHGRVSPTAASAIGAALPPVADLAQTEPRRTRQRSRSSTDG